MHYVYIIRSIKHEFTYTGQTSDLRERLKRHNAGMEKSTKAHYPYKLVYYEAFAAKADAILREIQLKKYGGASGSLKRRLHNSFRV